MSSIPSLENTEAKKSLNSSHTSSVEFTKPPFLSSKPPFLSSDVAR